MNLLRFVGSLLLPLLLATSTVSQQYGETLQDDPAQRDGGGHGGHGGGGGYGGGGDHKGGHGGGGGGHGGGGHGGGYGHPAPHKSCTPSIITKFRTVYKNRKAPVFNNVEIRNPKPDIRKVTESRYTTIRYPIFITQVLKPKLTQVETKVKPMFFTKTLNTYKKVFFTVTGIGQVTVTTIKYEKEYITRCQNKGYGHHRSAEDGAVVQPDAPHLDAFYRSQEPSSAIKDPPGIPYDYSQQSYQNSTIGSNLPVGPRFSPITTGSFGRPNRDRPGARRPPSRFRPQVGGLSPSLNPHPDSHSLPHPPLPRWPVLNIG